MERIGEGHHAGLELGTDAAAVTAKIRGTPGDDGAVLFQCGKGLASGEDLGDAGLELGTDAAAITAIIGSTPGDDGAVLFQCRKGEERGEDLGDAGLELSADAAAVTTNGCLLYTSPSPRDS